MLRLQSHPFGHWRLTLDKAQRSIGPRTGIIKALQELLIEPGDPPVLLWKAELTDISGYAPLKAPWGGAGCATIRGVAQAKAIGEALERYCGGWCDTDSLILGDYRSLASDALDPRTFPLCSEQEYAQADGYLSRFAEDVPIRWMQGYSLTQRRPILVPACFVFTPYPFHSPPERIHAAVSTGLGCGNSLEEAIFSGLCEVVERDAIMIMWLNRLSMPRVLLSSTRHQRVQAILDRWSGCRADLHVINITTDVGIPTFFAMAIDRSGKGPAAIAGAAAHLHPELAIAKALEEIAHGRSYTRSLMERRPGFAPGVNYANVKGLEDHILLYCATPMAPRLRFVYGSTEEVEVTSIPNRFCENDVLSNIRTCLDLLAARGLEPIVVDVTKPDIADLGFHVVRVLIPGMQPLCFGTQYRCLGGQRLYHVPYTLGYTAAPTTEDSLNRDPHPFP